MGNWNVIVSDFRCPHKYSEMKDSEWFEVCDLIRKKCSIDNCRKREEATPYANGQIDEFLEDLNNVSYVDLKTHKDDFPEFYIKVFDICQLREKWEAKKNE